MNDNPYIPPSDPTGAARYVSIEAYKGD